MVDTISGKSLKLLPPDVIYLKLKCTKFGFGWGSASDPAVSAVPAGEAYSAPTDPYLDLRGPTLRGRKGLWEE